MDDKRNDYYDDSDLPETPRLEIYKETFGCLEKKKKKWYKENRE